ncbi:Small ribosomal subunit biogenesis, partial [Dispira parvispora]
DFGFPTASNRVKPTRDGNYVMATGVYKPQLRVYEYSEMSMKFDRHTHAENVDFVLLSDDWTKSVHLQTDRYLEFQTQGGIHYRTRIPTFGRSLAYHFPSCELLVGGSKHEVYRLNLDIGRFMRPLETASTSGVNAVDINPAHQLFGFGTENGLVEFWDPRSKKRIGTTFPTAHHDATGEAIDGFEISALKFHTDGLTCAVGTSTGHVLLYDLRNARPYLTKDHHYGLPIKSLNWHVSRDHQHRVISADSKVIRIWDKQHGQQMTSIEPNRGINDVCTLDNTGMLFVANESRDIL